jgi:hypothetical protein
LFRDIFIFSELLPVVFYLLFFRRNKGEGLQVVFTYCLFSLAIEILAPLLNRTLSIGRFYLYASFTVVEYSLLTLFLYTSIRSKRQKIVPIVGSVVFFATTVANFLHNRTSSFDSLTASLEAILIIIYSILFLYEQIKDPSILFVYYTKKFWVVVAFFMYFSSTLFLFLYAASFTQIEHKYYWYINNIFDIIKNILFCIAFYMKKSKNPEYPVDNLYAEV